MAVIIGSARSDERGGIRGGQAGDQTGREVCTEEFYVGKQPWRCFRAKDETVADKIAYDMQAACSNNYIGYDQGNNQSLLHVSAPLGYDCLKVRTYCETDCSQLLRVCILYAGINIGMFSTADEAEYLMATGAFEEMIGSEYTVTGTALKRGDILVTRSKGHTVVVVSVTTPHVSITEDGWWGKATTRATQRMFGTPVDGIVSKQYRRNKRYLPNATDGWEWKLFPGTGSPMIRKLQTLIGAEADGIMGKQSVIALEIFLKERGLYDGSIDGVMGYKAVLGWQRYINSRS